MRFLLAEQIKKLRPLVKQRREMRAALERAKTFSPVEITAQESALKTIAWASGGDYCHPDPLFLRPETDNK